ncbi:MAG TPA: heavy metal sensor histidine kinase [Rhodocyclaceae bacterium]|nr:heavy metal sensor histidine kinase [Rhodocyclaceae bacterium]
MSALPVRSLTLRLAALFAAAAGIALLALGYIIGGAVDRHFQSMDRDDLEGKLELTRQALARVRDPAGLDGIPAFLDAALVGHHGLSVLITTANGQRLFASYGTDFPAPPPELDSLPAPAAKPPLLTWSRGERAWRGIRASLPTGIPAMAPVQVLVAQDIHHHQAFLAAFQTTLWTAVALTLATITLLGWLAARRGLEPVREMARVAKGISAERLHQRLGSEALPEELVDLADAFNGMLTRLEDSFQRLSHFSSDLAHELRTPVSNLMTQAQVALSRPRSADEYREVLYSSLEEYDRLSRMISDMLFLAKADNGLMVPSREKVDLAREVADLFEFYEALAEEKGIALHRQGDASVQGDRLMLRRALSNLVSNAIRYTPAGGRIEVGLESGAGRSRIRVENPGEAIPPEHLPHIFDRFYRVDPSRQKSSEGVGLGLAITRSIVEAHGGRIQVRSAGGRTCFEIDLPAPPSS